MCGRQWNGTTTEDGRVAAGRREPHLGAVAVALEPGKGTAAVANAGLNGSLVLPLERISLARRASYADQKMVTKPIVFSGKELLVNFSTSARGRMFVTVKDEAGKSIRSVELFGDKVDRPVDFADGGKVADFAGRPVTLTFEMSDADLYSFRFK